MAVGQVQAEPRLRDAQKQMTRQKLLESARQVFVERGYAAATVDEIAAGAGASRATFYMHFGNKLEVYREVATAPIPEALAMYSRLDAVLATASRDAVRTWMSELVDSLFQHRDQYRLLLELATIEGGWSSEELKRSLEHLADQMPMYMSRWGTDRGTEARLRVMFLSQQLERVVQRWFSVYGPEMDAERVLVAQVLGDIWFDTLSAPS